MGSKVYDSLTNGISSKLQTFLSVFGTVYEPFNFVKCDFNTAYVNSEPGFKHLTNYI